MRSQQIKRFLNEETALIVIVYISFGSHQSQTIERIKVIHYMFSCMYITGVSISSNCMRIQFLFQRHNFNVTDLLLKTLEQKVVTFFLSRFNKSRIREQLDDVRTPVIVF